MRNGPDDIHEAASLEYGEAVLALACGHKQILTTQGRAGLREREEEERAVHLRAAGARIHTCGC